jgi:hypothetical protein
MDPRDRFLSPVSTPIHLRMRSGQARANRLKLESSCRGFLVRDRPFKFHLLTGLTSSPNLDRSERMVRGNLSGRPVRAAARCIPFGRDHWFPLSRNGSEDFNIDGKYPQAPRGSKAGFSRARSRKESAVGILCSCCSEDTGRRRGFDCYYANTQPVVFWDNGITNRAFFVVFSKEFTQTWSSDALQSSWLSNVVLLRPMAALILAIAS